MWITQPLAGLLMSILIHVSHATVDYECDHELWDDAMDGRGVKKLEFTCRSGKVTWHGPYGGLIINIKGPDKEHQLCIQAQSMHTSTLISILEGSSTPRRLLTMPETKDKKQHKHTICLPAHGTSQLFVETDQGSFLSSKVVIEYDVEPTPKYGEDACSPCSDEELLYHYCTSDFVAIGRMKAVVPSPSANTISVSLDLVKRQSTKYFMTKSADKSYSGTLYAPAQCKMRHGEGKFIFMGKLKFDRAELKCSSTYEEFLEVQRTSKLKGTTLCT